MESLVENFLGEYFDLFFKNFDTKRDMKFQVSKGIATVQNLELNNEVLRELIGIESLDIQKSFISNCVINVTFTKISSVPIVIKISVIDLALVELEKPKPLPNVWANLVKKNKSKRSQEKSYGFGDKIADGISWEIEHLNIVLKMRGNPLLHQSSSVPLAVFSFENFKLRQTNEDWKIVDLKLARKSNKNQSSGFIFREAQMNISVSLVPCYSESDPAISLLKGRKLSDFVNRSDGKGNRDAGGVLGSTTLLDKIDILIRFTIKKNFQENLISDIQLSFIFNTIELTFNPLNIATISTAWEAFSHLLLTAEIERAGAYKTIEKTDKIKDIQRRKKITKSRVATVMASEQESKKPNVMVKVHIEKMSVSIVSKKTENFSGDNGKILLNIEKIELATHQTSVEKYDVMKYKFEFEWLDISSFSGPGLSSIQIIATPNLEGRQSITPFEDGFEDIFSTLRNENLKKTLFRSSYRVTIPCPKAPDHGKELHIRLDRIEFFFREGDLNFLAAYYHEVQERFSAMHPIGVTSPSNMSEESKLSQLVAMGFEPTAARIALKKAPELNDAVTLLLKYRESQMQSERASSEKIQMALSQYNTFLCFIEINGPTIHIYPRYFFVNPFLILHFEKAIIVGNSSVPLPSLWENKPFLRKSESFFPFKDSDYVISDFIPGLNRETTKLEMIFLPFGLYFSDGKQTKDPVLHSEDVRIGLHWDTTSMPQLVVCSTFNQLLIHLSQEQLHQIYLLMEEYTNNGAPEFWNYFMSMESDSSFEWTDLLDYLPNPSNITIPKGKIALNDVFALLPTYVIGYHFKEICFHMNKKINSQSIDVMKVVLNGNTTIIEHRTLPKVKEKEKEKLNDTEIDSSDSSYSHGITLTFIQEDIMVSTTESGALMERSDQKRYLFSMRFEDELSHKRKERKGSIERGREKFHARNFLQKNFGQIRSFVDEKRIFEKEGVTFQIGSFSMLLNSQVFQTLTNFFIETVSDEAISTYENLTKQRPSFRSASPINTREGDLLEECDDVEDQLTPSSLSAPYVRISRHPSQSSIATNSSKRTITLKEKVQSKADQISISISNIEDSLLKIQKTKVSFAETSNFGRELTKPSNMEILKAWAELKANVDRMKEERDELLRMLQDRKEN